MLTAAYNHLPAYKSVLYKTSSMEVMLSTPLSSESHFLKGFTCEQALKMLTANAITCPREKVRRGET
jgi:hypothetical protein